MRVYECSLPMIVVTARDMPPKGWARLQRQSVAGAAAEWCWYPRFRTILTVPEGKSMPIATRAGAVVVLPAGVQFGCYVKHTHFKIIIF